MIADLKKEMVSLADPKKAAILQRFFKTGKGEYAEGDLFLGINVGLQRELARKYKRMDKLEIEELLNSRIHEHRLTALIILTEGFKRSLEKGSIVDLYLRNTRNINNWDLVDLSSPKILGEYLLTRDRSVLYRLAASDLVWERRIAVLATYAFIRKGEYEDTQKLTKQLLGDAHDLIHKACGWMLREVGKRDMDVLRGFLDENYGDMPRTMLRYAIERLPEKDRSHYLGR